MEHMMGECLVNGVTNFTAKDYLRTQLTFANKSQRLIHIFLSLILCASTKAST